MKKVILVVVDACASRVLIPAMNNGQLPNFRALAEAGTLIPESIAVFPSITPAATASILTGRYPQEHGVLGYYWYDPDDDEVIYYGTDFWAIWNEGFASFFTDFLQKLNNERIKAKTLYQRVERAGLKAANLNYLIFRGDVAHEANVPFLLRLIPGIPWNQKVYGPSIMYFGDLANTKIEALQDDTLDELGGIFHRFGFDDDNTGHLLSQLARGEKLPDLTVAYFPDNDYRSHEVGPDKAVTALEKVDKLLGNLIAACGGLDRLLDQACLVLTGDHSQTDMLDDETRAAIKLDEVLADFSMADPGKSWGPGDQLVVCPDMRSAQIYFKDLTMAHLQQAVTALLNDPRVDQVFWRARDFGDGDTGYWVATAGRGRLRFWPGQDGPNTAVDWYGCPWSWEGDLNTVDGRVSEQQITFEAYPNAFERIVGGLEGEHSGHLWATAQPGYEFCLEYLGIHTGGGSHGSLHRLDSVSPLLVAGAPERVKLPEHARTVDVAPLILDILGLEPECPVDTSHVSPGLRA